MHHSDEYLQRKLETLLSLIPPVGARLGYRRRLRLASITSEALRSLEARNLKAAAFRAGRAQKRERAAAMGQA